MKQKWNQLKTESEIKNADSNRKVSIFIMLGIIIQIWNFP